MDRLELLREARKRGLPVSPDDDALYAEAVKRGLIQADEPPSMTQRVSDFASGLPMPGVSGVAGMAQPGVQAGLEHVVGPERLRQTDEGIVTMAIAAGLPAAGTAVAGPVGGVAGSYAARKLNVALGLEEGGPIGDIASVVIPGTAYVVGPALRAVANLPTGVLHAAIRAGSSAGIAHYLTDSRELTALIGLMTGYGPHVVRLLEKGSAGRAVRWLTNKLGPAGVAGAIGTIREGFQQLGEGVTEPQQQRQR